MYLPIFTHNIWSYLKWSPEQLCMYNFDKIDKEMKPLKCEQRSNSKQKTQVHTRYIPYDTRTKYEVDARPP